mmetsp:Transcript_5995/g.17053  ORF Transcript_5995/g.17053 Transcript_5995/m.17053 type:complete len:811 (+) Transcript_5995:285-2717(+)|eukprot:CAMPEP_0172365784 /NCGR_PEP_ID=MMETSP1060-20121228/12029_1 /TAXON_ID=37318 /ORGANISM="Pseudo-nitzschia pungens, Strain cf. cingulata" /LENGTH=810 /DNA_ID=CAMNT_0013089317 /DNA_START=206 /DNA_END=2638 /DNA_ORIENTATION=-
MAKFSGEEHQCEQDAAVRKQLEHDDADYTENARADDHSRSSVWSPRNKAMLRCLLAGVLLYGALVTYTDNHASSLNTAPKRRLSTEGTVQESFPRRRLTAVIGDVVPSYMDGLTKDLKERKKLFDETPPEEVKYWFEYTGPLQKYFYRFSKSRGKADYFEGRDDSGVTSGRFTEEFLGGPEHNLMFHGGGAGEAHKSKPGSNQHTMQFRLLENCLAMGSSSRPDTNAAVWKEWYGVKEGSEHTTHGMDRCRVLFTLSTVGAGRGSTMLWETSPPALPHSQGPERWTSEQETAATHLQRQLNEIDAMCATNQIAARVQVLVCEPIAAPWTEWMDSLLPNCGGKVSDLSQVDKTTSKVEDRASPVQVVVVATSDSAGSCHDLKSGFMERRTQDLILAPPFLGDGASGSDIDNEAVKTTHPDLVSSDDHDLYVGLKWTSMVTLRAVSSFLQASADIAAGANSPVNGKIKPASSSIASNSPSSPFLIPSFVRVSYVSEENAKVAKWRMHGDFFHPAAWEVCRDSFELTWIDHSLSGPGGVNGLCDEPSTKMAMKRRLEEAGDEEGSADCGQWWLYMTELQMPTTPDIYANEITPAVVQGGSNFVWMVTERQRQEIVKRQICVHKASSEPDESKRSKLEAKCPAPPQAVMPLGDLESFLINYSPNTALGKKHVKGRRPGYSREAEREAERELVKERKQLKGQEDIEKALFDYTIYPAALFRKDATLKAARARDAALVSGKVEKEKDGDREAIGPRYIKSSYYDVTVTKPRSPVLGWCQAIARKGLCTLYADYFRTSSDTRCLEACGMKKNFSPIR